VLLLTVKVSITVGDLAHSLEIIGLLYLVGSHVKWFSEASLRKLSNLNTLSNS
jgi:hypothetical protein